jgi:hypothetical protein
LAGNFLNFVASTPYQIQQGGPAFTEFTGGIGKQVKEFFESSYKVITDKMNELAKTVQADLMKVMNAACPKLT